MKLRVHADERALPAGARHAPLLYPFWGLPPEDPRDVTSGRFDRFVAEAPELFELTSFDDADICLFPAAWETLPDVAEGTAGAQRLAAAAAAAGKPFVVFFISDSAEPVPVEPAFVFRTSLYRSHGRAGELALPAWSEDLVEKHLGGELPLRTWRERPVVGFCGYDTPYPSPAKHLAKRLLGRPAVSSRGRVLRSVRGSALVDTNLVVRDAFFGGAVADGTIDYERQRRGRLEYLENIVDSDYALAARGSETWGPTAGNFSYRLYEVLSCGRIPIFPNTDSVLPYERLLDWKEFVVWLEQHELRHADRPIRAFHDRQGPEGFERLQLRCREVWDEYLSPHGFFRHFHTHFRP